MQNSSRIRVLVLSTFHLSQTAVRMHGVSRRVVVWISIIMYMKCFHMKCQIIHLLTIIIFQGGGEAWYEDSEQLLIFIRPITVITSVKNDIIVSHISYFFVVVFCSAANCCPTMRCWGESEIHALRPFTR